MSIRELLEGESEERHPLVEEYGIDLEERYDLSLWDRLCGWNEIRAGLFEYATGYRYDETDAMLEKGLAKWQIRLLKRHAQDAVESEFQAVSTTYPWNPGGGPSQEDVELLIAKLERERELSLF